MLREDSGQMSATELTQRHVIRQAIDKVLRQRDPRDVLELTARQM